MRKTPWGHIYVMRLFDSEYLFTTQTKRGCSYKIGKTKELPIRTRALGILMPHKSEVVIALGAIDVNWAEQYIHQKLAHVRLNGEWFALTRPYFQWLIVLGCPYVPDLCETERQDHDSSFRFYDEYCQYDPD